MEIIATAIKGLHEIRLKVIGDARGRFKRHFCERAFAEAGLETRFVQMNHAVTLGRGTIRGMHYQLAPAEEVKLVSCTYGRVFDVAVDLRPGSPTYRCWAALELDESVAYYIPKGCAHGFQALSEEAHLVYLHSAFYAPGAEAGVRHDDPAIRIAWPLPPANLSARDQNFPLLALDPGNQAR
ncbi:MAG: dTDP-4-dehydrorhamnose 3,5-epimerase [Sphingomonadales bacterium]|jgi:dTDP-4-dehydrorhamnose 3,5-epimerase|nr:dTDP-4-dehydrorhamnose 3,5-epimerase [Sphingomonadales bacterium]